MTGVRLRLLLVNPNTSRTVTRWLADEARRVAGDRFDIVAVNADSGVAAIETPDGLDRVASAVVAALAAHSDASAAIIGAFGDPALAAARSRDPRPIFGLGERGLMAAGRRGRRFAVVTLGAAMVETIASRAASLGLGKELAAIHVLPFSIAEMVEDRDARRDAIAAAVRASAQENGVEAALLGGAPFAGMAEALARELRMEVLDGVAACIEAAAAKNMTRSASSAKGTGFRSTRH
jgi:allantoin racemase